MELYRCFSIAPGYYPEAFKVGFDEFVSDKLNDMIAKWVNEMKAKHPTFRYRILNADSGSDPSLTNSVDYGIHTFIHILYEID